MQRVALREWLAILVAMLVLALGLGWQNGLGRLDQTLYDKLVSASSRPARDDIIIVAIDDFSLAELGRWPWQRSLHAELIEKINKANPRVIGLDIILSEAERLNPAGQRPGDQALADAISHSKRVVLPVMMPNSAANLTTLRPIPEFESAARALGHINLVHDSDGVVRSVYLREAQSGRWWPHFALALQHPEEELIPDLGSPSGKAGESFQRASRMHIPFSGNSGHFKSVPFVSVLRGEVPDAFFTGKYVLIGATAVGLTDSHPTPVSGNSGAMAGVEINANVLASLLEQRSIAIAQPWQTALFSALPVLLAMLAYLLLAPRFALLAAGGIVLLTFLLSGAALREGLWLAPSAALIALIISYPLWSWRRLEAAIAYLGQEFGRLDREPHLLPEAEPAYGSEQIEDELERRINAMKNATRRVRDLRQFVSDSLDNLPDATVVTTIEGRILLANRHANDYFASIGARTIKGAALFELFAKLKSPQLIGQAINSHFEWSRLLDLRHASSFAGGISVRDEKDRDLLVKSAPCHSANNLLTGWIVSVIDISTMRAAERSRDEILRFLSHDMRSPQASIIALLELQNAPESALPLPELFARIEKASRRTLGLADNFVQLARAESHEYRLEEVNFQDILFDACDEMWTRAKGKNISLDTNAVEGEYPVYVDRALMTRALSNLLSNAINYSPDNTRILLTVRYQYSLYSSQIVCSIKDQGYGIEAADQAKLFHRFQRVDHANQPRHEGIGLGLVFVKTVIERHHGQITFFSKVGEGTTFTLVIPCTQA
ncbi:CHASE2 domain-containing protein [soil metagenome]